MIMYKFEDVVVLVDFVATLAYSEDIGGIMRLLVSLFFRFNGSLSLA